MSNHDAEISKSLKRIADALDRAYPKSDESFSDIVPWTRLQEPVTWSVAPAGSAEVRLATVESRSATINVPTMKSGGGGTQPATGEEPMSEELRARLSNAVEEIESGRTTVHEREPRRQLSADGGGEGDWLLNDDGHEGEDIE